MVQQKIYHQHNQYEGYDGEISCYNGFEGSNGIGSTRVKQDRKFQAILQRMIFYVSEG